MRGHWESGTRKLNRHYQSAGGGWYSGGAVSARLIYANSADGGTRFATTASGWDIPSSGGVPGFFAQSFTKGQTLYIKLTADRPGIYLKYVYMQTIGLNYFCGYFIPSDTALKTDYSILEIDPAEQTDYTTTYRRVLPVEYVTGGTSGYLMDDGIVIKINLPSVSVPSDYITGLRFQIYVDSEDDDRYEVIDPDRPWITNVYKTEAPVTISVKVRTK